MINNVYHTIAKERRKGLRACTQRVQRLGDGEAGLVEGAADDDGLHGLAPQRRERPEVVEGSDAAGGLAHERLIGTSPAHTPLYRAM
jgi:hypothetical protein